jgi:solute carrier family 25 (peroxisomal adenine nucleotide transporter), member 17
MSGVRLSETENAITHALAGVVGSVAATGALFPLDSLRSIQQIRDGPPLGSFELLSALVKRFGLGGAISKLYQGMDATLGTMALSQALSFFMYEWLKAKLARLKGSANASVSPMESLVLAYLAGAINVTITTPLWTAAKRLQVAATAQRDADDDPAVDASSPSSPASAAVVSSEHLRKYEEAYEPLRLPSRRAPPAEPPRPMSLGDAVMTVIDDEGVWGLYRSLPVSLVLCANPALHFFVYEQVRQTMLGGSKRSLTALEGFSAGVVSKAIATVLTFPLQVVQTRLMAGVERSRGDDCEESAPASERHTERFGRPLGDPARVAMYAHRRPLDRTLIDALAGLLREGGVPALFKGMGPKLLQTVLNSGILFAVYERLLGVSRWVVILAFHKRLAA